MSYVMMASAMIVRGMLHGFESRCGFQMRTGMVDVGEFERAIPRTYSRTFALAGGRLRHFSASSASGLSDTMSVPRITQMSVSRCGRMGAGWYGEGPSFAFQVNTSRCVRFQYEQDSEWDDDDRGLADIDDARDANFYNGEYLTLDVEGSWDGG